MSKGRVIHEKSLYEIKGLSLCTDCITRRTTVRRVIQSVHRLKEPLLAYSIYIVSGTPICLCAFDCTVDTGNVIDAIDLSHNSVKCGFEMLHEIGLAL